MARKNPAWVIVTKKGRIVGTEAYYTRIRAEQELTKPSHRVIRLSLTGGMVRKKKNFPTGDRYANQEGKGL